jgi:hypothetical protein
MTVEWAILSRREDDKGAEDRFQPEFADLEPSIRVICSSVS